MENREIDICAGFSDRPGEATKTLVLGYIAPFLPGSQRHKERRHALPHLGSPTMNLSTLL
jgi:hypothetical protein